MTRVTIVDYLGNLGSVSRALEWLGAEPEVTDEPEKIAAAGHLILPGDGAFGYGMQQLRDKELVEPLLEFIASGKPFLGICVGMQLLLSESEEFGHHDGLGVIPGRVVPFPPEFAKRYRERGYWADKSLAEEFDVIFKRFANRVVLIDRDKSFTYAELDRDSTSFPGSRSGNLGETRERSRFARKDE